VLEDLAEGKEVSSLYKFYRKTARAWKGPQERSPRSRTDQSSISVVTVLHKVIVKGKKGQSEGCVGIDPKRTGQKLGVQDGPRLATDELCYIS